MIYLVTIIFFISFLISFIKDKRKLINAFLLFMTLFFSFLSIMKFSYDKNFVNSYKIIKNILYLYAPLLLAIMSLYFIINGFITRKKESKSLSNSLSMYLGMVILFYLGITLLYIKYGNGIQLKYGILGQLGFYLYLLVTVLFAVFIFVFISFLVYSILYLNIPKNRNYDYIIIHGSGLIDGEKVPPLLASRINKAIEAFNLAKKPDVKFIPSGGQGDDEKISEARAISNYLIDKGFSEKDIILEDKSTTTYENLMYSMELVKNMKNNPQFLFVSNNYHILRASFYAKKLKMRGEGLGSRTAAYYIPSAFIREYIAILNKMKIFLIILSIIFTFLLFINI